MRRMEMLKRVILPLDGSTLAESVLPHGAAVADWGPVAHFYLGAIAKLDQGWDDRSPQLAYWKSRS